MGDTCVVSIGRKVGQYGRLDDDSWENYKQNVRTILDEYGDVVFDGEGYGLDSVTGNVEEAFTVVVALKYTAAGECPPGEFLRHKLAEQAGWFGQKEIAVTYGETVFAGRFERR